MDKFIQTIGQVNNFRQSVFISDVKSVLKERPKADRPMIETESQHALWQALGNWLGTLASLFDYRRDVKFEGKGPLIPDWMSTQFSNGNTEPVDKFSAPMLNAWSHIQALLLSGHTALKSVLSTAAFNVFIWFHARLVTMHKKLFKAVSDAVQNQLCSPSLEQSNENHYFTELKEYCEEFHHNSVLTLIALVQEYGGNA